MAIVKKCDRCGVIYEHYENFSNNENSNGVSTIHMNNTGTGNFTWRTYDLCRKCMFEFDKFIHNDLKENET